MMGVSGNKTDQFLGVFFGVFSEIGCGRVSFVGMRVMNHCIAFFQHCELVDLFGFTYKKVNHGGFWTFGSYDGFVSFPWQ
jgi:hypothetical protein